MPRPEDASSVDAGVLVFGVEVVVSDWDGVEEEEGVGIVREEDEEESRVSASTLMGFPGGKERIVPLVEEQGVSLERPHQYSSDGHSWKLAQFSESVGGGRLDGWGNGGGDSRLTFFAYSDAGVFCPDVVTCSLFKMLVSIHIRTIHPPIHRHHTYAIKLYNERWRCSKEKTYSINISGSALAETRIKTCLSL